MKGLRNASEAGPDPKNFTEEDWIDDPLESEGDPESEDFDYEEPVEEVAGNFDEQKPHLTRREIKNIINDVLFGTYDWQNYNFPYRDGNEKRALRRAIRDEAARHNFDEDQLYDLIERVDRSLEERTIDTPLEYPFGHPLGQLEYFARDFAAAPGHLENVTVDVDTVVSMIPGFAAEIADKGKA